MKWLHWFSLVVAACALVVIAIGALVTNDIVTASIGDVAWAASQHRMAADGLAFLVIVQVLWLVSYAPFRGLAGICLVLLLAEIFVGRAFFDLEPNASPAFRLYHAVLAQLLFALSVVIATLTAPFWQTPPIQIPDKGWPSLRGFAALTAVLVFVQVILGAAFRHNLLGVMWHMVGALFLALFVLGLVMLILNPPAEAATLDNPLRVPAIALLVTAGFQIVLGLNIVSLSDNPKQAFAVAVLTVTHTVNGALVFAITTVLMLLARRHTAGATQKD